MKKSFITSGPGLTNRSVQLQKKARRFLEFQTERQAIRADISSL